MIDDIAYHACGSATKSDGTQLLVVAGAEGDDEAGTWTEGDSEWT